MAIGSVETRGAGPMPDGHALRETIGIGLGLALVFLISAGLGEVRDMRDAILTSQDRIARIEVGLERHTKSAADANLALAKILGVIDARLVRLEQSQEARSHARERGRD